METHEINAALKQAKRDYIQTPPNQTHRREMLTDRIFKLAEEVGRPIKPDHRVMDNKRYDPPTCSVAEWNRRMAEATR